jgi:hypothetical protein
MNSHSSRSTKSEIPGPCISNFLRITACKCEGRRQPNQQVGVSPSNVRASMCSVRMAIPSYLHLRKLRVGGNRTWVGIVVPEYSLAPSVVLLAFGKPITLACPRKHGRNLIVLGVLSCVQWLVCQVE